MKPQKFPTKVDHLGSHVDPSQGVRVENECWGDSTCNYAFIRLYILYTCLHKATQHHIHALTWHLYNTYNSSKVAYGAHNTHMASLSYTRRDSHPTHSLCTPYPHKALFPSQGMRLTLSHPKQKTATRTHEFTAQSKSQYTHTPKLKHNPSTLHNTTLQHTILQLHYRKLTCITH